MTMKLKITDVKLKSFTSKNTGEEIEYFWYNAVRDDGVDINFGSKNGDHEGDVELEIGKRENAKGGFTYTETL